MIRRGRETDAAALRQLQSQLREPSPALLRHALSVDTVFVSAVDAGDTTAVAAGDTSTSDATVGTGDVPVGYLLPVPGDGVHVAELVVHPDYRREGRATRLLRRVLAAADERVTLLVHPENDAARGLYEAVGFDTVGRRPGFYVDADAIVMAREPLDTAESDA